MAGRFPLYTDADVQGPVVRALQRAGWDVMRAIEALPEGTSDPAHFEHAITLGRVLVTNDEGQRKRARHWYTEGRAFPGVIWWPQPGYRGRAPGDFLRAFEKLAQQQDPFSPYPILHLISRQA